MPQKPAIDLSVPAHAPAFLDGAGWGGADIVPMVGDASFRRYFRVENGAQAAILMDAPPPHEDPRPFIHIARYLTDNGLHAPQILAEDAARGLVLLEDFGNDRVREHLDANPGDEQAIYAKAIDALHQLHQCPPADAAPYDMAVYLREAALLTEFYAPARGLDVDLAGYEAAWRAVLAPVLAVQQPGVTVLRDYHAENIMLLADGRQGLLDFQDALIGHPAYDLVSLLQDARRDVTAQAERAMLDHYQALAQPGADFEAHYHVLGAQRNAKIVGIFVRLWKRDGKPRYLSLIPRVWAHLERDLAHPALAPVRGWFDANIPAELRAQGGGEFAA